MFHSVDYPFEQGDAGDPPKMFPFEVTSSNHGAPKAILKREFAGEIIKAVVDIDYYSILEPAWCYYSDGEYEHAILSEDGSDGHNS